MNLRRARSSDLSALERLELLGFPDPWNRPALATLLQDSQSLVLSAEDGTEIVGYAAFGRLADQAELLRLAVSPRRRRRGIAALLLREGFSRLGELGVVKVFLEVRPDNRAALELYRVFGFEEVARRRRYYRDGSDAVVLAVDLESLVEHLERDHAGC